MARNLDGQTLLDVAIEAGHMDAAKLLSRFGVCFSKEKTDELMLAAVKTGDLEFTQFFAANDPARVSDEAWSHAASHGYLPIISYFFSAFHFSSPPFDALLSACRYGQYDVVRLMLDSMVRRIWNTRGISGYPSYIISNPMSIASMYGYSDIVQLLVEFGVTLDQRVMTVLGVEANSSTTAGPGSSTTASSLHRVVAVAVRDGDIDTLSSYLRESPRTRNFYIVCYDLLRRSLLLGHLDIAMLLIDENVHLMSDYLFTNIKPNQHIEPFLGSRSDELINARTPHVRRADCISEAEYKLQCMYRSEVLDRLSKDASTEANNSPNSPVPVPVSATITECSQTSDPQIIQRLLDAKASVSADVSALTQSLHDYQPESVKLLLDAGADFNPNMFADFILQLSHPSKMLDKIKVLNLLLDAHDRRADAADDSDAPVDDHHTRMSQSYSTGTGTGTSADTSADSAGSRHSQRPNARDREYLLLPGSETHRRLYDQRTILDLCSRRSDDHTFESVQLASVFLDRYSWILGESTCFLEIDGYFVSDTLLSLIFQCRSEVFRLFMDRCKELGFIDRIYRPEIVNSDAVSPPTSGDIADLHRLRIGLNCLPHARATSTGMMFSHSNYLISDILQSSARVGVDFTREFDHLCDFAENRDFGPSYRDHVSAISEMKSQKASCLVHIYAVPVHYTDLMEVQGTTSTMTSAIVSGPAPVSNGVSMSLTGR
jgi:ankyrin repeat protein